MPPFFTQLTIFKAHLECLQCDLTQVKWGTQTHFFEVVTYILLHVFNPSYLERDQESGYKLHTQNEKGGQCFHACRNGGHRNPTEVLLVFGNIHIFILLSGTMSTPARCRTVPSSGNIMVSKADRSLPSLSSLPSREDRQ